MEKSRTLPDFRAIQRVEPWRGSEEPERGLWFVSPDSIAEVLHFVEPFLEGAEVAHTSGHILAIGLVGSNPIFHFWRGFVRAS